MFVSLRLFQARSLQEPSPRCLEYNIYYDHPTQKNCFQYEVRRDIVLGGHKSLCSSSQAICESCLPILFGQTDNSLYSGRNLCYIYSCSGCINSFSVFKCLPYFVGTLVFPPFFHSMSPRARDGLCVNDFVHSSAAIGNNLFFARFTPFIRNIVFGHPMCQV